MEEGGRRMLEMLRRGKNSNLPIYLMDKAFQGLFSKCLLDRDNNIECRQQVELKDIRDVLH